MNPSAARSTSPPTASGAAAGASPPRLPGPPPGLGDVGVSPSPAVATGDGVGGTTAMPAADGTGLAEPSGLGSTDGDGGGTNFVDVGGSPPENPTIAPPLGSAANGETPSRIWAWLSDAVGPGRQAIPSSSGTVTNRKPWRW